MLASVHRHHATRYLGIVLSILGLCTLIVIGSSSPAPGRATRTPSTPLTAPIAQPTWTGPYQIHHNISGQAIGEADERQISWIQFAIGTVGYAPESISLNEACENQVQALENWLSIVFPTEVYMRGFHDHYPNAAGCEGGQEYGVYVLQRGLEVINIAEGSFPTQADNDEDRGYVCVTTAGSPASFCSAHSYYGEGTDAADQFLEYRNITLGLSIERGIPVAWAGDLYRNPSEIQTSFPTFYTDFTEADRCPSTLDRPTVINSDLDTEKTDHIFLRDTDGFSCAEADVTPITHLCDTGGSPAAATSPSRQTTTSLPPPTGCDNPEEFDHSLIVGRLDPS